MRHFQAVLVVVPFLFFGCGGDGGGKTTTPDTVADTTPDTTPDTNETTEPDTPPPSDPSCAAYCTEIQAACTGEYAQYASDTDCIDYCENVAAFDLGTTDDTTGNTVGCRTYHATVAATSQPEIHCAHAGPTGGDACGTWCENYCHLATKNCAADNALYDSPEACDAACAVFRIDGDIGSAEGNTVQCRLYHLGTPASGDPATHCGHGAETPTDFCVDPCEPTCTTEDGTAKACGDDGCGGSCGDCVEGEACNENGQCECVASCDNADGTVKACGDDGCGGSCGDCAETEVCNDSGQCECVASCDNADGTVKACGDDGCGGSCGDCAEGDDCDENGLCFTPCVPNCANADGTVKECGDDGCGATCGDCGMDYICSATGTCVMEGTQCMPVAELVCGETFDTATNGIGSTNLFSSYSCSSYSYPSNEITYSFTATDNTQVTFTDTDSNADLIILKDEGMGCTPTDTSCIANGISSAKATALAGETLYLIIDAYNGNDASTTLTMTCCIADCTDKFCGDDGCGGSCGECPLGEVCNGLQDACEAPSGGNICADAGLIDSLPFVASSDTSVFTNNYEFGDDQCEGEDYGKGGASMDVTYTFTPTDSGPYNVHVDSEFDAAVYVVTDCDDIANTCVGAQEDVSSNKTEELQVTLEAGITYFIIVDGYSSSFDYSGPFTLTVDACIPACDGGKTCGPDTCGGTCGTCLETEICPDTGICEPAAEGDNCGSPLLVDAVPFTYSGDTSTFTNTMFYDDGDCDGETYGGGAASNDNVFMYEPTMDMSVEIILDASFDSSLYAVTDCADVDSSCLGAHEASGEETIKFPVTDGTTYFIIVDGYSDFSNYDGTYTLTINECVPNCDTSGANCGDDGCGGICGECAGDEKCNAGLCEPAQAGDGCGFPIVIDTLPFTHNGDTTNASNTYSFATGDCPGVTSGKGGGSNDNAFIFAPDNDGVHTFTVEGFDASLYVVEDCSDIDNTCVAAVEKVGSTSTEKLLVTLTAGNTYFVIVDGYSNISDYSGPYTFTADFCVTTCDNVGANCGDDGCGGTCGECTAGDNCIGGFCTAPGGPGDTCDNPVIVDAVPYSYSGDTEFSANDYGWGDGVCPNDTGSGGSASNDDALEFTPDVTDTYTISLDNDFDGAIYVVTDCADVDSTCVGAAEKKGSTGIEELHVALDAGVSYSIIVDGYSNFSDYSGAYTLSIDMCVPVCADTNACGDNACAGSCGECAADENCVGGVCEAAGPGDTCADPYVVDTFPYSHSGDTDVKQNDYNGGSICKTGLFTEYNGSNANDVVYMVTPTDTGEHTFEKVGSGGPSFIYYSTDCDNVSTSCLGNSGDLYSGGTFKASLDAGVTYYFFVDGLYTADDGPYTLTITGPSGPCEPECTDKACGDDGCGGSCGTCGTDEACSADGQCETVCTANCTDKVCGDDGCGGSCGDCPAGEACDGAGQCAAGCIANCTDKVCGDDGCGSSCGDCGEGENCSDVGQCEAVAGASGDTCDDAWAVDAFPYNHSGDTTNLNNDYGGGALCEDDNGNGDGADGLDAVYAITATNDGTHTITLTCTGAFGCGPTIMYVASDCADTATTCLGDSNDMYSASGGTLEVTLTAGSTAFLIVDGLYSFDSGPYDVTIEGPAACTADCSNKMCGDDGCGGSCGDCGEDETCSDTFQCEGATPAGMDLSGWILKGESNSGTIQQFVFPEGTFLENGGTVVIGRNADQADFMMHWGSLADTATYFSGSNTTPIINGNYAYTLVDPDGFVVDGPTVSADSGSLQRLGPNATAGLAASWVAGAETDATPGDASVSGDTPAGMLYISEMSDASGSGNYIYEFIELHLTGGEIVDPPAPSGVDVGIGNFQFNDAHITVAVGTTVTWTNNDSTTHTVNSADANNSLDATGPLDSGSMTNGDTFSHTFNTAGVFLYRCKPHASMKGSVTVQ